MTYFVARLRAAVRTILTYAVAQFVHLRWLLRIRGSQEHRLPGRLVVSLTSYPPRFATLALTLKCLLSQSVKPDAVELWIAEGDFDLLPGAVLSLQARGLILRQCADLKSYKKIVPGIIDDADVFRLIADDDVFYGPNWLKNFTEAYRPGLKVVLCGRAHRIRIDSVGQPLPYLQWEGEVYDVEASSRFFPTGVGGVLYEPGIFHPDVARVDIFQKLCPSADDIWLFWMASLNGATFRIVGKRKPLIMWAKTQDVALAITNGTQNDLQILNMISTYGFPMAKTHVSSM